MTKSTGFSVIFSATEEEVFSLVASAEGMSAWLTASELRLRKSGRFLSGDYRVFTTPLGRVKEQIIQCDPNRFLSYRIVEGSFLEGIEGQITVTKKGDFTRLDWDVEVPKQGSFKTAAIARGYSGYLFSSLQYFAWKQRSKGLLDRVRAA